MNEQLPTHPLRPVLAHPLRPAILAAAKSSCLERTVSRAPITKQIVQRFVASDNLDGATAAVNRLLQTGRAVSVDHLGEDTTDASQAQEIVQAYLALLGALTGLPEGAHTGAPPKLEVSMKLSALGRALGRDGDKIALENARTICAAAQDAGVWVSVDAEDHTTTDSTLAIVTALREDFPWVGAVLQAYLRRTAADCRDFAGDRSRVRLCKGAYQEPASVAYTDRDAVDDSYLRCLQILMRGSGYPMVATHDPRMISAAAGLVRSSRRGPRDFEYQMLYGIRDAEQLRLAELGNTVRVYLPYGSQWYGYFMRRLAERPANVLFFLRALTSRE